jgi:hypothetical protein
VQRGGADPTVPQAPLRGSRRVDWIESALAPVRARLTERVFARLVSAVSLCVGAEALIVLRDIRGLDRAAAADVCAWAASALLRASLNEPPPSNVPLRRRSQSSRRKT